MKFTQNHIEEFLGLLLHLVAKHSKTPTCSHYDMLQQGLLGLAEAIKSFNPAKNVPLKLWVYRLANSSIIKCRYKNSKERRDISGYDNSFFLRVESQTLSPNEELIEKEERLERKIKCEKVCEILKRLTINNPVNYDIYVDRMINNESIGFLCQKYNLSHSALTQRISKLSNLIKEELRQERIIIAGDNHGATINTTRTA